MKVLILEHSASSFAGGAEKSMRNFCEHLSENHTLFLGYHESGNLIKDSSLNNIYQKTIKLGLSSLDIINSPNWIRDLFILSKFIRENKIDIILTHLVHISPFLRIVRFLNGIEYSIYYKWVCSFENVGRKVRWGNKKAYSSAAVSQFVAKYWVANGIDKERINVIPEGVNPYTIRDACSFFTKSLRIGFAGRIVPEKGLEDLINAISILNSNKTNVSLRIAGNFSSRESQSPNEYHIRIDNQVKELGLQDCIHFDGFVSPLESWFSEIDLLIVPSTCQDAQPLVMMQAMSTGTPVIGTRVGGIPEILVGDFKEFIALPNNPSSLAEKINLFVSNPSRLCMLGEQMYEYVHSKYNMSTHFSTLKQALCVTAT